jgi:hypothetical protein
MIISLKNVSESIDVIALGEYAEAQDKKQYVSMYCRDMFGNCAPLIQNITAKAFREVAEMNGVPLGRKTQGKFMMGSEYF